jgi:hypothetical protein
MAATATQFRFPRYVLFAAISTIGSISALARQWAHPSQVEFAHCCAHFNKGGPALDLLWCATARHDGGVTG